MHNLNNGQFTFEEFGNPVIPGCTIVFEFGIADSNSFTFIDEVVAKHILTAIDEKVFSIMDFFCAIRYYRDYASRKRPQKFDYYIARFVFSENTTTFKIIHERGPRYLSPMDVLEFLAKKINEISERIPRRILKKVAQPTD